MNNHPTPKPKHDGGEDKSTKCHVYVEPGVQIGFIKDFREEYTATQKDNTTHNKKQLLWTKVSAFLLLVYVGLTLLIYRVNKKSADVAVNAFIATRKSSESETRAMVKMHRNGELQAIPNKTLELPVRVNNIGRTPAKNVVASTYVEIVPKRESPNLSESDVLPLYQAEVGDLFPGDYADFNVRRTKAKGEVRKGGATEIWFLTDEESKGLKAGETYVAVHGRVAYDDIFHVRHWTNFCFWYPFAAVDDYKASKCVEYNTEDSEDEP
jgi:hypothetical protein